MNILLIFFLLTFTSILLIDIIETDLNNQTVHSWICKVNMLSSSRSSIVQMLWNEYINEIVENKKKHNQIHNDF